MHDTVDHRAAHVLLREATRDDHEDTEASDGMRRLMDGMLSEAGYAALLRAQLGLFEAWEAERGAWLRGAAAGAGWAYVSRAGLLREDLGMGRGEPGRDGDLAIAHIVGSYTGEDSQAGRPPVGAHDVGDPPHEVPQAGRAPVGAHDVGDPPREVPQAGRAPVGAHDVGDPTHDTPTAWGELYVVEGSALGGRLIARRLRELYPDREHRFYAVGEDAPSAWRRFQHLLDTHLPDDASCRAAVDGARGMFARFRRTLKEPTDV
ncbi:MULTISPECIES: biliverdin-producing heme oxygenase [unclassified Luteibacter]|uniref:biliverdin-producing heme oxygenase n=1 Tax=Luteibacter sp. PvP019 TaxID=3156436 RepID=UPI003395DFB8